MRKTLLLGILSCGIATAAYVPASYGWDDPLEPPEVRTDEPVLNPESGHYHYHPTLPDAVESNPELLSVTVPRHARRGLATSFSVRYRKVSGSAIVRIRMSPGLELEQANPPAARGLDGELLWFGLAGPTGNLKLKARVDAEIPVGTALLIQADLIDGQGKTEQQTETIVVR